MEEWRTNYPVVIALKSLFEQIIAKGKQVQQ
jgi:hypothetical protein